MDYNEFTNGMTVKERMLVFQTLGTFQNISTEELIQKINGLSEDDSYQLDQACKRQLKKFRVNKWGRRLYILTTVLFSLLIAGVMLL